MILNVRRCLKRIDRIQFKTVQQTEEDTAFGFAMLIHDGIYHWEGWGGTLKLGSGSCRLRIFNLEEDRTGHLIHMRPMIVVVSDIPDMKMSIRSCAGHIATGITREFGIEHQRMLYVEYYPATRYGERQELVIAEILEMVEFKWHEGMAMHPKWRPLNPPLKDMIKKMIEETR